MKKLCLCFFLVFTVVFAQAEWSFYEETSVKGMISGIVKKDHIFEMQSGSIYQITGITIQVVVAVSPHALVLRDGRLFKIIVDDFDEPLICKQLIEPRHASSDETEQDADTEQDVIHSHISGDFEGWNGDTLFMLDNGQIWQQSSYDYTYHYSYHPEVLIININGIWKMKVEDVDEMIEVKRLK